MASIQEEVTALRRIPLFAHIEPSKLKLLAFTSERITFGSGENIFCQGDEGDAAYVIIEGTADVLVNTPTGEISVAALGKNAFVGEIAIICDTARTATVRATSDLQALKIAKEQFLKLIKEFPDLSIEMMRVLAERLRNTTEHLTEARARLGEQGT